MKVPISPGPLLCPCKLSCSHPRCTPRNSVLVSLLHRLTPELSTVCLHPAPADLKVCDSKVCTKTRQAHPVLNVSSKKSFDRKPFDRKSNKCTKHGSYCNTTSLGPSNTCRVAAPKLWACRLMRHHRSSRKGLKHACAYNFQRGAQDAELCKMRQESQ